MKLHTYWRSSAAYRVRIALNIKGFSPEMIPHDLSRAEHQMPAYRALNPQGFVPALETGVGELIPQSLAIIEWLEDTQIDPPILPAHPTEKAIVRAMAYMVACDIHPLNNLRVINHLRSDFGADEAAIKGWMSRWMREGFTALEAMVAQYGAGFCFDNGPTMADCCLIPQLYNARRFGVDLSDFPQLLAVEKAALRLPAFIDAHPDKQPDAVL